MLLIQKQTIYITDNIPLPQDFLSSYDEYKGIVNMHRDIIHTYAGKIPSTAFLIFALVVMDQVVPMDLKIDIDDFVAILFKITGLLSQLRERK